MLDLDRVDLGELCMALEDNSPEHSWWVDPRTGAFELWSHLGADQDEEHPEDRGLIAVEPIDSAEGYSDMEDFSARVPDARSRDHLLRAIAGRGAFRRFKDTLLDLPDLREDWFAFHDARMQRRAIEWLATRGMIGSAEADRALAEQPEPQLAKVEGPLDARSVAVAVARDLRDLYGNRLKSVVLFGSWARGEAHPESDIDLLVILDEVRSRWRELDRMSDVLWRHSLEHDVVVTEMPVSEAEYQHSDEPLLVRARAEGVPIT